jgi:PilZ domain
MEERRSETRMLCADMVDVRWKDRSGKEQGATAILEDISPSGACLQLELPIPVGVEVCWDSPKQKFRGWVRYCVYREIGYFAGVEFDASFKWSKKAFKPDHLLDPQSLVGKR